MFFFVLVELYNVCSGPKTLVKNLAKSLGQKSGQKYGPPDRKHFGKVIPPKYCFILYTQYVRLHRAL